MQTWTFRQARGPESVSVRVCGWAPSSTGYSSWGCLLDLSAIEFFGMRSSLPFVSISYQRVSGEGGRWTAWRLRYRWQPHPAIIVTNGGRGYRGVLRVLLLNFCLIFHHLTNKQFLLLCRQRKLTLMNITTITWYTAVPFAYKLELCTTSYFFVFFVLFRFGSSVVARCHTPVCYMHGTLACVLRGKRKSALVLKLSLKVWKNRHGANTIFIIRILRGHMTTISYKQLIITRFIHRETMIRTC